MDDDDDDDDRYASSVQPGVDAPLSAERSRVRISYEAPHPGALVELANTPACHAGDRRFEPGTPRHFF